MSILLQKSASIPKSTSHLKIDHFRKEKKRILLCRIVQLRRQRGGRRALGRRGVPGRALRAAAAPLRGARRAGAQPRALREPRGRPQMREARATIYGFLALL